MTCKKCGSQNVTVQMTNEVKLVNKHHGVLWWLLIGWYWVPIKWIFLTVPALLAKIFIPKRQKAKNIEKKICLCQNCGYSWEI